MLRRIDRVDELRGKASRSRGSPHWPHAIFEPAVGHRGRLVATSCRDESVNVSWAKRLEQDNRLPGRAANWLFIKGGIIILLMLGLFVLGLMGLFR